jgi:hypothetical protein
MSKFKTIEIINFLSVISTAALGFHCWATQKCKWLIGTILLNLSVCKKHNEVA